MVKSIQAFIQKYKMIFILVGLAIGIGLLAYLSIGRIKDKYFVQQDEKEQIEHGNDNEIGNDNNTDGNNAEPEVQENIDQTDTEHYIDQPPANNKLYKPDVKVKGIYVSGWVAGTKNRLDQLISLINETELNAMVIDVKEDRGKVTYKSEVKWVNEAGAVVNMVGDIGKLMEILKDNNVFPIARVVCFKDPLLSEKYPDVAVKTKSGSIWRDRNGNAWLNPYDPKSWDFIIELSKEAARLGFKEIQYDYVRFPTDGNVRLIDYGDIENTKSKAQAIAEFLTYAKKELEPMGVDVSADIFGIVPIVTGDFEKIGQDLEMISQDIDYICPMVYPSHYANAAQNGVGQNVNNILFKYPDLDPYGVVYNTLVLAKARLDSSGANAKVRPWLQSFTASYLGKGNYQVYGGEQIRQQIQGTYDAGLEEWILWDPNNQYTAEGLLKEQ